MFKRDILASANVGKEEAFRQSRKKEVNVGNQILCITSKSRDVRRLIEDTQSDRDLPWFMRFD